MLEHLDLASLRIVKAVCRTLLPRARETISSHNWRTIQRDIQFDAGLDGSSAAMARQAVAPLLVPNAFPTLERITCGSEATFNVNEVRFAESVDLNCLNSGAQAMLVAPILASNTALERLCLSEVDWEICQQLLGRQVVTDHFGTSLEEIKLEENHLTDVDAGIFGQLLRANMSMKYLHLVDIVNSEGVGSALDDWTSHLLDFAPTCRLTEVSIVGSQVSVSSVVKAVSGLALSSFVLRSPEPPLESPGHAQELADLLHAQPTLTAFDIGGNRFRGEAAQTMARAVLDSQLTTFTNRMPIGSLLAASAKSVSPSLARRREASLEFSHDAWEDPLGTLGVPEALVLAKCVSQSCVLAHLRVPCNRLARRHVDDCDDEDTNDEDERDEQGLLAIANALLENRSIRTLDLAGSYAHGQVAARLAAAVLASPSIECFSGIPIRKLRANAVDSFDASSTCGSSARWCGELELMVLASLAPMCSRLISITLGSSCFIGDDGGVALVDLLQPDTLQHLELRGCSYSIKAPELVHRLSLAILCSRSLRVFSGIPLRCSSREPLAVDLSCPHDDDPGEMRCGTLELSVLADVLNPRGIRFMNNITTIDLRDNILSDSDAELITKALMHATHLISINLLGNHFSTTAARQLRAAFVQLPDSWNEHVDRPGACIRMAFQRAFSGDRFPNVMRNDDTDKVVEAIEQAIEMEGDEDARHILWLQLSAWLHANPLCRTRLTLPDTIDVHEYEPFAGGLALRSLCEGVRNRRQVNDLTLQLSIDADYHSLHWSLRPSDLILIASDVRNLTSIDLSGNCLMCTQDLGGPPDPTGCIALLHALQDSRVTSLSLANAALCSRWRCPLSMHVHGHYNRTCLQYVADLLMPVERSPLMGQDEACPVIGLCPFVGDRYQVKDMSRAGIDLGLPVHEVISEAAYLGMPSLWQCYYSKISQSAAGDIRVFVYPETSTIAGWQTIGPPHGEWTGRTFMPVGMRIDSIIDGAASLRQWIVGICGQLRLAPHQADFWLITGHESAVKLPCVFYGIDCTASRIGLQDLDSIIVTDAGARPRQTKSARPPTCRLNLTKLEYAEPWPLRAAQSL